MRKYLWLFALPLTLGSYPKDCFEIDLSSGVYTVSKNDNKLHQFKLCGDFSLWAPDIAEALNEAHEHRATSFAPCKNNPNQLCVQTSK